jgi:hypothetical protein
LLRANARSIESHLGGGALNQLNIIVSIVTYAKVAPVHPWVNPESPVGVRNEIVGATAAALLAKLHRWEEAVSIFGTRTNVEQALEKQIITAFEPIHLGILNNDMVGFANTTARDMIDHLFLSYGSITALDLEHNWVNMRKSWYPKQPVESRFKKIQDYVDYTESGGITISEAQKIQNAYANIFAT